MEIVFSQLATEFARESLEPGTLVARGNVAEFEAPAGVYRCDGEGAYCALSVDGDEQWRKFSVAIGRDDLALDPRCATSANRVANREGLDAMVVDWMATRTPGEAQRVLQESGVSAAAVAHVTDLMSDPALVARGQIALLAQPGYDEAIPVTAGPTLFENLPAPRDPLH
ncbi:CoA transferase [Nocardia sp. NPDC047654]|jgi:crotonobetainyl-CoA:carnitine CoA-transferase CaiB-like acyl-CoA transferase|uniref:CoA transferase n=1 Tax=Nocardia sp. NPDC047654 TaxID=3364314 RepID=UPI0037170F03